jgi:hypothetical protein
MKSKCGWQYSRRKGDPDSLFLVKNSNSWNIKPPHIVVKIVEDKIKIIEVPEGNNVKTITMANPDFMAEFDKHIDLLYGSTP